MANQPDFYAPSLGLQHDVPVRLWPHDVPDDRPLPLLVVNDGPEYDDLAHLTEHMGELMASGRVVPHRVALLEPVWGFRNDWYGASPAYHDTLAKSIIPEIRNRVAVVGPIAGMGASLGAISLLGTEYTYPGTFGALRLQSTAFHHPHPDFDGGENDIYGEYGRVAGLVEKIASTPLATNMLQIGITWCDRIEYRGNTIMSNVLSRQEHVLEGGLVPGGHNYASWEQTYEPVLANVLERTWGHLHG